MLLIALVAAARPQACTLENAQPATVREIAAAPDRWFGRCVRLEGLTTGQTFYQDVEAGYRRDASDKEDRPNDGWLGLYPREGRVDRRRPRRASVAGIVQDCGRNYEAAEAGAGPEVLIMSVGYCHYNGGLILGEATIRHGARVSLPRLTGDKARLAVGDLLTVNETGAPPAEPLGLLRRFVAAVRAGDSVGAAALAGSYNVNVRNGPQGQMRWRRFLTAEGPFAFLRKDRREPIFFRARQSREDAEYDASPDWFACFCRTRDCKGLWPISVKDAVADYDPAYACIRLYRAPAEGEPWTIGIETRKTWSFADRA